MRVYAESLTKTRRICSSRRGGEKEKEKEAVKRKREEKEKDKDVTRSGPSTG